MKIINKGFQRIIRPEVNQVIDLCIHLGRHRQAYKHGKSKELYQEILEGEQKILEHFPSMTREEIHRLVGVVVEAASLSLAMILGMEDTPASIPKIQRTVRLTRRGRGVSDIAVETPSGDRLSFKACLLEATSRKTLWTVREVMAEFESRDWTPMIASRNLLEAFRNHLRKSPSFKRMPKDSRWVTYRRLSGVIR